MGAWFDLAMQQGLVIDQSRSELHFLRHEHVVATTEGANFTRTTYESGGTIIVVGREQTTMPLNGLTPAGKGWELVLEADIPAQLRAAPARLKALAKETSKALEVGRYTLVCDGATMASLLDRTFGIATQVDRAMGYEANSSGTSFLDDPLAMLGTFRVASPLVTVTANRSAPGQLATVKWDDEGVIPDDFTLVKDGVLVDYQTTREQSAWLAPYYQKVGRAVRSHGCATADSAQCSPIQQTPNLALAANQANISLDDLVATVKEGILVTDAHAKTDFQVHTGILRGTMHEIKNGRVGRYVTNGAITFNTLDLWKHVTALGGPETRSVAASSAYPYGAAFGRRLNDYPIKGEPPQRASNSIDAAAAVIGDQTLVNLSRKA
jgi:TldD protein